MHAHNPRPNPADCAPAGKPAGAAAPDPGTYVPERPAGFGEPRRRAPNRFHHVYGAVRRLMGRPGGFGLRDVAYQTYQNAIVHRQQRQRLLKVAMRYVRAGLLEVAYTRARDPHRFSACVVPDPTAEQEDRREVLEAEEERVRERGNRGRNFFRGLI